MKKLISSIVTIAFILTQCGLGMAAPVYNKVGQNLRQDNPGEPADASGKPGKTVQDMATAFASGGNDGYVNVSASADGAPAMSRRDFLREGAKYAGAFVAGGAFVVLYNKYKAGPKSRVLSELELAEEMQKTENKSAFTVDFSTAGQIRGIEIPKILEPYRSQLRLFMTVKSPGWASMIVADEIPLSEAVGRTARFSTDGAQAVKINLTLAIVFSREENGLRLEGIKGGELLTVGALVPPVITMSTEGLMQSITVTGTGEVKTARATGAAAVGANGAGLNKKVVITAGVAAAVLGGAYIAGTGKFNPAKEAKVGNIIVQPAPVVVQPPANIYVSPAAPERPAAPESPTIVFNVPADKPSKTVKRKNTQEQTDLELTNIEFDSSRVKFRVQGALPAGVHATIWKGTDKWYRQPLDTPSVLTEFGVGADGSFECTTSRGNLVPGDTMVILLKPGKSVPAGRSVIGRAGSLKDLILGAWIIGEDGITAHKANASGFTFAVVEESGMQYVAIKPAEDFDDAAAAGKTIEEARLDITERIESKNKPVVAVSAQLGAVTMTFPVIEGVPQGDIEKLVDDAAKISSEAGFGERVVVSEEHNGGGAVTVLITPYTPVLQPVSAKLTVLAIAQDVNSARAELQEMLQQGYQLPTGESITMENIRLYQLPDNWTKEDIEREAKGTQVVIFNVDGIALQKAISAVLATLGLPAAPVREGNWREALDSV